jgi:hypothetical protein
MNNLDHIAPTATAVDCLTIVVGTPPVRLALMTCGKGLLQVGRREWVAQKPREEKEKGAKVEKGKEEKGENPISAIWEIGRQSKMEETGSVTIGLGGMAIASSV